MDRKPKKNTVKKSKVKISSPPVIETEEANGNTSQYRGELRIVGVSSHVDPETSSGATPASHTRGVGSPSKVPTTTSYVAPPSLGDSVNKIKKSKKKVKGKKAKKAGEGEETTKPVALSPTREERKKDSKKIIISTSATNTSIDSNNSVTQAFSAIPTPPPVQTFQHSATSFEGVDQETTPREEGNSTPPTAPKLPSIQHPSARVGATLEDVDTFPTMTACLGALKSALLAQEKVFQEYDSISQHWSHSSSYDDLSSFVTPKFKQGLESQDTSHAMSNPINSGYDEIIGSPGSVSLSPFSRPLSVVYGHSDHLASSNNPNGQGSFLYNPKISPPSPGSLNLSFSQNQRGGSSGAAGPLWGGINESPTSKGPPVPPPPLSVESLTSSRATSLTNTQNSNPSSSYLHGQLSSGNRNSFSTTNTTTRNSFSSDFSPPSTVYQSQGSPIGTSAGGTSNRDYRPNLKGHPAIPNMASPGFVDVLVSPITPHPQSVGNTSVEVSNPNQSTKTLAFSSEEDERRDEYRGKGSGEGETSAKEEDHSGASATNEESDGQTVKRPASLRIMRRPPMVPPGPTPLPPGTNSTLLISTVVETENKQSHTNAADDDEEKWSFERQHELMCLPPELRGAEVLVAEEEDMEDIDDEREDKFNLSKFISQNMPRSTDLPKVRQRGRRGCRHLRHATPTSSNSALDPATAEEVGSGAGETGISDLRDRMEELLVYKEENRQILRSAERGEEEGEEDGEGDSTVRRRGRRGRRGVPSVERTADTEAAETEKKDDEEEEKEEKENSLIRSLKMDKLEDEETPSDVFDSPEEKDDELSSPRSDADSPAPRAVVVTHLNLTRQESAEKSSLSRSTTTTSTISTTGSLTRYQFCAEKKKKKKKASCGKKKDKEEGDEEEEMATSTQKTKTPRYVVRKTPRGLVGTGKRGSASALNKRAKEQSEFMAAVVVALSEVQPKNPKEAESTELRIDGRRLSLNNNQRKRKSLGRRKTVSHPPLSGEGLPAEGEGSGPRPRRATLPALSSTALAASAGEEGGLNPTADSPIVSSSFMNVHQNLTQRKERNKLMEEAFSSGGHISTTNAAPLAVHSTSSPLSSYHSPPPSTELPADMTLATPLPRSRDGSPAPNANPESAASNTNTEVNPNQNPSLSPSHTRRKIVLQPRIASRCGPAGGGRLDTHPSSDSTQTPTRRKMNSPSKNNNNSSANPASNTGTGSGAGSPPPPQHVLSSSTPGNSNPSSVVNRRRASLGEDNVLSLPKRQPG